MSTYDGIKKILEATLAPSIAQIKEDTAAVRADVTILKADLKRIDERFDDLIERLQLRKEIDELKRKVEARAS